MKFFKALSLSVLMSASFFLASGQGTWKVDKAHSNVQFTVTHMSVSEVSGKFNAFDGSFSATKPDLSDAKISFTVEPGSIDTDNEYRDNHLKGDDFFNAEKYPKATFTSTSFKKKSGNKYVVEGDLTIRDITKRVKFDVVYGGMVTSSGKTKTGFKVTGSINRFDYNLKWNKMMEGGGLVVGDAVALNLNLEFDKQ